MRRKTKTTQKIREAVGMFNRVHALEEAIDELGREGFNHAEISLLDHKLSNKKKLTKAQLKKLEDDPKAPRRSYIPSESWGNAEGVIIGAFLYVPTLIAAAIAIAYGASLATTMIAAIIAGIAGGYYGFIFAKDLENRHQNQLQQQIDNGGILLWVRTWDKKKEQRALAILKRHHAKNAHIHEMRGEIS